MSSFTLTWNDPFSTVSEIGLMSKAFTFCSPVQLIEI